jgi:DNA-directed RNA polymerase specialized sigma24 family protein
MGDALLRYRPVFYRSAFRYLGNTADAEDAVQDALLSAYKRIGQFRGQAAEFAEHINRLVRQLSPTLRRTFQLRELDGLTIRETANVLGMAEGTVKAQLARARTRL